MIAVKPRPNAAVSAAQWLQPPLLAGAILILFMIKPLFAKPVKRDNPRSLTRQGEPRLFVFVDQLCDVVGAPKPSPRPSGKVASASAIVTAAPASISSPQPVGP